MKLDRGDLIVQPADRILPDANDMQGEVFVVIEGCPPYPPLIKATGHAMAQPIDPSKEVLEQDFEKRSPQGVLQDFCEAVGFVHDDGRCPPDSSQDPYIVTRKELAWALTEVNCEIRIELLNLVIGNAGVNDLAEILVTLFDKYQQRREKAAEWFENVGYNQKLGTIYCTKCGNSIIT